MSLNEGPRRSAIIGNLRLTSPPDEGDDDRRRGQPAGLVPSPDDEPLAVIVELNGLYPGGLIAARRTFADVWLNLSFPGFPNGHSVELVRRSGPSDDEAEMPAGLRRITDVCFQTLLSRNEIDELVRADRARDGGVPAVIHKIWPDYELDAQIDRSAPTVKADAAWRSFAAEGKGVVWAVIDSGIDGQHRHFGALELAAEAQGVPLAASALTAGLHRDFSSFVRPDLPLPPTVSVPLEDEYGHGTHVAGIIAGRCSINDKPDVAKSDELGGAGFVARTPNGQLSGMAPLCELVSLKVFRQIDGDWKTSFSAVMAALDYIRKEVNVDGAPLRIHGANISLGCRWDPSHYAAGQSPLCQSVNRLVDSGVVVVISAGNSGKAQAQEDTDASVAVLGSITEPGHAEGCITVGSTHRDAPHTFGVSWTSSKGPTLDGRSKPDLVAPGEWITSACTGTFRVIAGMDDPTAHNPALTYAEESGTSMAAPHVSGVIAGFLSARPEFISKPRLVKDFVCSSAVDLGRERHFQGAGLVDALAMLTKR